jgi:hypothetical protein
MPETCPSTQLPGNGFGQNGSGWNLGTPGASEGCPIGGGNGSANAGPAKPAMMTASRNTLDDPIIVISSLVVPAEFIVCCCSSSLARRAAIAVTSP